MSKISQEEIAKLVDETRPNIKKWLQNPEEMPVRVYKQLQVLGIDLPTQEWHVVPCEFCDGTGFRLRTGAKQS